MTYISFSGRGKNKDSFLQVAIHEGQDIPLIQVSLS